MVAIAEAARAFAVAPVRTSAYISKDAAGSGISHHRRRQLPAYSTARIPYVVVDVLHILEFSLSALELLCSLASGSAAVYAYERMSQCSSVQKD